MANERITDDSARALIALAMPYVSPSVQADLRRVDKVLEHLIETVDAVLSEMRARRVNHGRDESPTLVAWADRLNEALERAADCVTCFDCDGSGSIETRHPSGNPELDTEETCGACWGTGEVQP